MVIDELRSVGFDPAVTVCKFARFVVFAISILSAGACGSSSGTGGGADGDGTGGADGTGDGAGTGDGDGTATGAGDGDGPDGPGGVDGGVACGTLEADFRDFRSAHPDFEQFAGNDAFEGLVESQLGADQKPVYAHPGGTAQTTGPDEFNQWYRDVPQVNMRVRLPIVLQETQPGVFVFDDSTFFPLDGTGFGNEGNPNNFHFTTEIHTRFRYRGGEIFTFTGDDDLWLFINGTLAIDLGGLHPALTATVDLDAEAANLGISPGNDYAMDIFHAERRTDQSNFRIETTIECLVVE